MKILAIEKESENTKSQDFKPFLKAEAKRVWELYQQNIIREMYFRQDISRAVLILECENVEEAQKVLKTLPLVRENLIYFELIPLVPYPGFSRLFSE